MISISMMMYLVMRQVMFVVVQLQSRFMSLLPESLELNAPKVLLLSYG
jgi:hypothetical protein